MKLTRRELAAAVAGVAAAPAQQSNEQLLKEVQEETRRAAGRIAKLEVPMDVEPAFVFRSQ